MTPADPIEGYLAGLPDDQRVALEDLRAQIRVVVPEATERISYRMPSFEQQGRIVVWYAAFARHCSIFPASEGVIEACGGQLTPYLHGKGTIRFTPDRPLPRSLVRKIVRARLRENAAARRR
jgi:uncharacterized protein YdhG (YjbR/CyaY superfamily)